MILSTEFGVTAAVVGLYASYHLNVASGPAMALVATAIFAVVYAGAVARQQELRAVAVPLVYCGT